MRSISSPLSGFGSPFGGAIWTPAQVNPTLWMDAALPGLYTDTAGTVNVTAAAQAVARGLDRSGRGNTLLQATGAFRPIYSLAPPVARRNKLNYSSDLTVPAASGGWGKGGAASVADAGQVGPNGNAAQVITYSGVTSLANVYQATVPVVAGQTLTASIWIKAGSAPNMTLRFTDGDGTTIRGQTLVTPTGSFVRYQTPPALMTVTGNAQFSLRGSFTAAGTVIVCDAQFEQASTPSAFQKTLSAYEYYETGYTSNGGLYFDRADDAMAATIAAGFTGDELLIGRNGYRVTANTIAAGGTYTLSPPAAIGDLIAVVLAPTMSADTISQMTNYYAPRGGSQVAV